MAKAKRVLGIALSFAMLLTVMLQAVPLATAADNPALPTVALSVSDGTGEAVTVANVGQTIEVAVKLTPGTNVFTLAGGEVLLQFDDTVVEPLVYDTGEPGSISDMGAEYADPENIVMTPLGDAGLTGTSVVAARNLTNGRPLGLVKVEYTGNTTIEETVEYLKLKFRVKSSGDPAIKFAANTDFPESPGTKGYRLMMDENSEWESNQEVASVSVATPQITFALSSGGKPVDEAAAVHPGDSLTLDISIGNLNRLLVGAVAFTYDADYLTPVVANDTALAADISRYATCGIAGELGVDYTVTGGIDTATGAVSYTVDAGDNNPLPSDTGSFKLLSMTFTVRDDAGLTEAGEVLSFDVSIAIGKALMSSLPFPPLHTVRATFTAHGVPSILLVRLYRIDFQSF